jgi:hypothetical protein
LQAVARHPGNVKFFQLDPVLCPKGKFAWKDAAGQTMRGDDGIHFTPAGGTTVGNYLFPQIVSWANPPRSTKPTPG